MGEYSMARTIPVGWERLTEKRDTRTFWNGVKEEATRLTKTALNDIAIIRDRHLALEAWFLSLPAHMRKADLGTTTKDGVTKVVTLKAKYADAHANTALLDACKTNSTVVHVIGTDIKVSVAAAADADAGASREFTIAIELA